MVRTLKFAVINLYMVHYLTDIFVYSGDLNGDHCFDGPADGRIELLLFGHEFYGNHTEFSVSS